MLERRGVPCDRCLSIVSHVISGNAIESYDKKWLTVTTRLIESGKTCRCCEMLWDLIVKPALVAVERRLRINLVNSCLPISFEVSNDEVRTDWSQGFWAIVTIILVVPNHAASIETTGLVGVSVEDKDDRHPHFWTLGRTTPHLTIAEDRIRCAKDWFETCEKDGHRDCQPSEGILPSRLIDLRASQVLRLVNTNSLDKPNKSVRYAALSHSWGPPGATGPLKTTRDTVQAFGTEIPGGTLPKTFRDAIRITQSLSIPFLWIDSLCIIQDDPDEWQREASRMKDVYSGSVLTISASCGRDSCSGFLPEDDGELEVVTQMPGLEPEVMVKAVPSIIDSEHLGQFSFDYRNDHIGRHQSVLVRVQAETAKSQLEGTRLSTRGWVCQEEILSHRTLHCLDSEIHWRCKSFYHTQSGRSSEEGDSNGGADLIKYKRVEDWWYWIQNYTERDFTISSDRMPAFSGITQLYEDKLGEEILLGARPASLSEDLSWMRVGPEKVPADTGAPSWSWLSCNAPVHLDCWWLHSDDANPKTYTVAINCRVDWTGPAMTSAIERTHFRIRGPVMQMALRIAPEGSASNPPNLLIGEEESGYSSRPLQWRCAGQFDHENHPGNIKADYTCLLLFSHTDKNSSKQRETFLLLLPDIEKTVDGQLENTRPCSFHRVGIAMIEGSDKMFSGAVERTLDLS